MTTLEQALHKDHHGQGVELAVAQQSLLDAGAFGIWQPRELGVVPRHHGHATLVDGALILLLGGGSVL